MFAVATQDGSVEITAKTTSADDVGYRAVDLPITAHVQVKPSISKIDVKPLLGSTPNKSLNMDVFPSKHTLLLGNNTPCNKDQLLLGKGREEMPKPSPNKSKSPLKVKPSHSIVKRSPSKVTPYSSKVKPSHSTVKPSPSKVKQSYSASTPSPSKVKQSHPTAKPSPSKAKSSPNKSKQPTRKKKLTSPEEINPPGGMRLSVIEEEPFKRKPTSKKKPNTATLPADTAAGFQDAGTEVSSLSDINFSSSEIVKLRKRGKKVSPKKSPGM